MSHRHLEELTVDRRCVAEIRDETRSSGPLRSVRALEKRLRTSSASSGNFRSDGSSICTRVAPALLERFELAAERLGVAPATSGRSPFVGEDRVTRECVRPGDDGLERFGREDAATREVGGEAERPCDRAGDLGLADVGVRVEEPDDPADRHALET